jgi:hydroxymethylglutaryl-CoA lyase
VQPASSPNPSPESPTPVCEIIGIILNERGLERALATPGVTTVGYPYSVLERFQRQNANMSQADSRTLLEKLLRATTAAGRDLVVYISMAFGNPWGDPWSPAMVEATFEWLKGIGVKTVSLADTVGTATPEDVSDLFRALRSASEGIELGVHLHSRRDSAAEKVLAAYEAGCRRFDTALTGLGGCPFAGDELVGNIPTESVIATLTSRGEQVGISREELQTLVALTQDIHRQYAR